MKDIRKILGKYYENFQEVLQIRPVRRLTSFALLHCRRW